MVANRPINTDSDSSQDFFQKFLPDNGLNDRFTNNVVKTLLWFWFNLLKANKMDTETFRSFVVTVVYEEEILLAPKQVKNRVI